MGVKVSTPNATEATFPAAKWRVREHTHGLVTILGQICDRTLRDDLIDLAAEMAYFFVLAIFPFFIVLGALAGFLPYSDLWTHVSDAIVRHFPAEARGLALQTLLNLAHRNRTFLSLGSIAVVWTSSSGVVALMENLSKVYGVAETRSFWKKRLIAVGIVIVTSAFFMGSFGLLTLGHRIGLLTMSKVPFVQALPAVWPIFRWCFLLVLLQTAMAIIDHVLPNKRRPWHWITPGMVFATLALVGGTSGVNLYVRHIGHYYETYGAIGAFFVLMVWIFVSSLTVLIGAEMNSVIEKRRYMERIQHQAR